MRNCAPMPIFLTDAPRWALILMLNSQLHKSSCGESSNLRIPLLPKKIKKSKGEISYLDFVGWTCAIFRVAVRLVGRRRKSKPNQFFNLSGNSHKGSLERKLSSGSSSLGYHLLFTTSYLQAQASFLYDSTLSWKPHGPLLKPSSSALFFAFFI